MKPAGVSEVMKFAQKVEERNAYSQRKQWGLKVGPHREHELSPLVYSSWPARPIPFIPAIGPFNPFTAKCDTKFSSGHRCQNKKLQVLLVQDEFPKEDIVRIPDTGEMPEADVDEIAELSVNSMVGLSALKTMKLKEKIAHQEVVTMIDCGVTHNFISTRLIQKLGISLQATTSYGVVKGEDIYREVSLTLQNIERV